MTEELCENADIMEIIPSNRDIRSRDIRIVQISKACED